MGFKVRKSFKVAPGVRVNVGKKSAGVSFGTKGLRYSVNSRTGARVSASIPGTGIGYTTSLNGGKRNYSSKSYSRNSELKKLQRQQEKLEEIERNKLEVELYLNRIEMIKSIHKECDQNVDWIEIEKRKPPFNLEAGEKGINEIKAIKELENYKPSLIDKLFKRDLKKIEKLKKNIDLGIEEDKEEYALWRNMIEVAKDINNGVLDTYFKVIEDFRPLDDLLEFGSEFEFFIEEKNWIEVDFEVKTEKVVPNESKSLTKTGKVSVKKMTKTAYYDLQQDYVCSCALRIARDMFALLPIEYVVINALDNILDTSAGKYEKAVILSVKIDKENLDKLNMDLIDPSDSMKNFNCNMKFKKTSGLMKVDRVIKR